MVHIESFNHDALDLIIASQITGIADLKRLFCVSKVFQVLCKKRFVAMNCEMETQIREKIQFLLTPDHSPLGPEIRQKVVELLLYKEFFLHTKHAVLHIAESIFEMETKSSLNYRELKGRKIKYNLKDHSQSSQIDGEGQKLNIIGLTRTNVLLLCRSTTDTSRVIRSKVRAYVRKIRAMLDSAMLKMDAHLQRVFSVTADVKAKSANEQALRGGIKNCALQLIALVQDRVLIGARTITKITWVDDPGAQVEVSFVENDGIVPA